ncbi:FAD-dependent oxidoreductase [Yaniella flava]|uniref:FAD-dependent oxidoreductase n=1 Tax=Yaniella flava TaxID=287930 RepID=A0ABP5FWT7_9MICC
MVEPRPEERECDVLVVGSGVAGLSTAIVAAHRGLRVVVAEQNPYFGGTTAISAGWAWVPGNPGHQSDDSTAEVKTYLKALAPENFNEERLNTFLDTVPEAIEFFEKNTEVNFVYPEKAPDYQMDLPGSRIGGRAILPGDADVRMLGKRRRELQPYLSSYTVFGYMPQVGADLTQFLYANRSIKSFAYAGTKLARTWLDQLVKGQPMKRTNGSAMITRMVKSALDAGVQIWTSTPVESLVQDSDGTVTGAILGGGRHSGVVNALEGVVLAGGGFTGNTTLRRKYFPHDPDGTNHVTPTVGHNGGSAVMAMTVGGRISNDVFTPGSWAPVTEFKQLRDGRQRLFPHLRQIGLPGMITVDRKGRRFGNEALSYHDFGRQLLAHDKDEDDTYAWIIADEKCMDTYGIGYAKPWPIPRKYFRDTGFLVKADTLSELAAVIGADPDTLETTVERFNGFARSGEDEDFGRGSTAYNHFRGDMAHKPNPNLAELKKAPYYAACIRMGDLGSFAGLDVDNNAAVLNAESQQIPGLHAVGASAVSVFGGGYPGYGSHIGPAMIFGYRLGRDIGRR